jgi:hypothetical protein
MNSWIQNVGKQSELRANLTAVKVNMKKALRVHSKIREKVRKKAWIELRMIKREKY